MKIKREEGRKMKTSEWDFEKKKKIGNLNTGVHRGNQREKVKRLE